VHGICGDHRALQIDVVQQFPDLGGLVGDPVLGDDHLLLVQHGGEQLDLPVADAAQPAVGRQRTSGTAPSGRTRPDAGDRYKQARQNPPEPAPRDQPATAGSPATPPPAAPKISRERGRPRREVRSQVRIRRIYIHKFEVFGTVPFVTYTRGGLTHCNGVLRDNGRQFRL
jgi:hypothetical protein